VVCGVITLPLKSHQRAQESRQPQGQNFLTISSRSAVPFLDFNSRL